MAFISQRQQKAQESIMKKYHTSNLSPNQCGSTQVQILDANLPLVWSTIKLFDNPQAYEAFIKSCEILAGNGTSAGSVRKIQLVSGLAAKTRTERLDSIDEEACVMKVSRIGGDDRLSNYKSTTTLHESEGEDGKKRTVLIESYVVDIPSWSCREDTCCFVDTFIGINLRSLARVTSA